MSNIAKNIKSAAQVLQENGIIEPRREANSLLAFALQKDKTFLIAHSDYELSLDEQTCFQNLVHRRAAHEPFQYITGHQEFYGLDFEVTPDVLIPRPETELIVENAIKILSEIKNPRFCEIGVGSGCISIAILNEIKTARAIGLDVSEAALKVAKRNAEQHTVLDRFELKISDVFAVLQDEKFDLIVSNPPYVPLEDIESLQAEVRDFEPVIALTDNKNGLSIIEKIINEAPSFLNSGCFLLMEIGFNQAEKVRQMFSPEKWQMVEILPDLQCIPRMIKAQAIK